MSRAVTVDPLGNVFLAWTSGENGSNYDTALSKYDANGNLKWTQTFKSAISDLAYAVASDGAGNAYMGGVTTVSADTDAFLRKINSDGSTAWARQFGTIAGDEIDGLSTDGLGAVYAAGQTRGFLEHANAGLSDAFVGKFDAAGNQVWMRQFGGNAVDVAWGVSVDHLGNVFISGTTLGTIGGTSSGSADTFTIKLDSSGQTQWVRQWGTPYYDQSYAVQADGTGGTYIAGYSPTGTPGAGTWMGDDAFVAHYDAEGHLLWISHLTTGQDDIASGLAVDSDGNVYVSGWTRGTLAGTNAGGVDSFISKFSADGIQQWVTQYGTDASDSATGLAVDINGNIYSSGLTEGSLAGPFLGGRADAYLLKLSGPQVPEPSTIALIGSIACMLMLSRDSGRGERNCSRV